MPTKKKAKRPAQTNPSAYYYVVEITRAGGKSHLITTREDEAKATARIARDRDGNPTEVFRINLVTKEKRIAFLRAVMKDPAAIWKKAAQQLTFRSADNQPKKQTDGSTTENRTGNSQAPSQATRDRTGGSPNDNADEEDNDAFWGGLTTSEEDGSEEEGLFEI